MAENRNQPELKTFRTEGGHANASLNGISMHSGRDPFREAERLLAQDSLKSADLLVLFGLGMAYLPEMNARSDSPLPVLVIDPLPGWFSRLGSERPDLALTNLAYCPEADFDALTQAIHGFGSRSPVFVANPAYRQAFPEDCETCRKAVDIYRQRTTVNSNTLKKFSRLWVRNLARNLPKLLESQGIKRLEGLAEGLPCLLLAGGPSLDLVIPHLGALRERMLVAAVDTAGRACVRAGIDPDILVTIDPQYWNSRHLDFSGESRALLVSEPSIYPRSLRITRGPVFFCESIFPLGKYFESALGEERGKLGAGGSVATGAWDLLRRLGGSEIWTAGLDLSYPHGQTHYHGSLFEEATHNSSRRLRPAEMERFRYLNDLDNTRVPADGGGTVLSDSRMGLYAQWFETQERLFPNLKKFRFGFGARAIGGFVPRNLKDALGLPVLRPEIDRRIGTLKEALREEKTGNPGTSQAQVLEKARHDLCSELQNLKQFAGKALELAQDLEKLIASSRSDSAEEVLEERRKRQDLFSQLDTIDSKFAAARQSRILGFLMEEAILKISASETSGLQSSLLFYEALVKAADFHLKLFSEAIPVRSPAEPPI